ncbi:peptidoglycan editing factor PgeF [Thermomonas sp.]|uniref:peptidoglycan editing factor PgeF n=1 Tax=Thermomonas sp. TaxID=1971895 RepID=UPI003783540D
MSAFLHADWPAPPGVHALTSLRHGLGVSAAPFDHFNLGSRCGDDVDAVIENRRQLQAALHLPSSPRWLRQVHGVAVAVEPGFDEPEADAAVTVTPGRVLAILTADCLPVVLASRAGDDIGAAHAGWRGLCAGVLEATVGAMRTPAQQLMAWLGPAAGPQAYEIGEDVFAAFVQRDPAAVATFVATRPGHWKVDLYALARQRLQAVGVTAVFGGEQCTISDPARFFSHRRDQRGGRIATLVWMQA